MNKLIISISFILLISISVFFNLSFFTQIGEVNINNGEIRELYYIFNVKIYEKRKDTFFSKEFVKFYIRNKEENWKRISELDLKVNIFKSRHYDSKFGILAVYCNNFQSYYDILIEEDDRKVFLYGFYQLMKSGNIEGIGLLFKEKRDLFIKKSY